MTCPGTEKLMLLAMDQLDEALAASMRRHLEACEGCRRRFRKIRRDHVLLIRTYETMDVNHDSLREELMASLPEGGPDAAPTGWWALRWRRLRGTIAGGERSLRAAGFLSAAAVIVAVAAALLFSPRQGVAFAQVLDQLRRVKNMTCRVTRTISNGKEARSVEHKLYMSSLHGCRLDTLVDGNIVWTSYFPTGRPITTVDHAGKIYVVAQPPADGSLPLDRWQPSDVLQRLRDLTAEGCEELGLDLIDAAKVKGFRIPGEKLGMSDPGASAELWVEHDTGLPVKLVVREVLPEAGSRVTEVYDRFEWNRELEASLFEPEIPESYARMDFAIPSWSEETLINGLRVFADLSGGAYPKSMDPARVLSECIDLLAESVRREAHDKIQILEATYYNDEIEPVDEPVDEPIDEVDGVDETTDPGRSSEQEAPPANETLQEDDDVPNKLMVLLAACRFFQMRLVMEGHEPEYFGAKVRAGEADKVLVRWRLDEHTTRVIYGDLRVETVSR